MWDVRETKAATKALDKAPAEVKRNYDAWVQIVRLHGPRGLRDIKGFHDEALSGALQGSRSSRLNLRWRVIYMVSADVVTIVVRDVNAHKYKR
jgi:mRNA-degrading endonuclease YafQ of YafQ-DinJ toxin-antitoxin module